MLQWSKNVQVTSKHLIMLRLENSSWNLLWSPVWVGLSDIDVIVKKDMTAEWLDSVFLEFPRLDNQIILILTALHIFWIFLLENLVLASCF